MKKRFRFWHERLDVYRVALQFVAWVKEIDRQWFRGNPERQKQLCRAADSIVLNIAEGSSQTSVSARANFYRIAFGSAGPDRSAFSPCFRKSTCPPELVVTIGNPTYIAS